MMNFNELNEDRLDYMKSRILELEKQNYKYAKEVLYHGKPNCDYSSKALDLLNYADMHIDKKGNYVSFEQRLEDIKNRRGAYSQAFINSKQIIEELKKPRV